MPRRVQRKRTKGWRMPPNTIYVGRPTKWGNPVRLGLEADSIDYLIASQMYRNKLLKGELPFTLEEAWAELAGKNLACWCPLNRHCHADVLLDLLEEGS